MIESFDSVSPSVGNQGSTAIRSAGMIHAGNAVLYLFTPRKIIDHYKRPMSYNFSNQLVDSIIRNVVERPAVTSSCPSILNSTPNIHESIIPSGSNGIHVGTSKYSDFWTFILIYDEDPRASSGISSDNRIVNRNIMIGICMDEPVAQSGFMSATPEKFLNPNCQLVVTKKLQFTRYLTVGHAGPVPKIKTAIDQGITHIDPSIWQHNPGDTDSSYFFSLSPADILESRQISDDTLTNVTDYNTSINRGKHVIVSEYESPRRHMAEIIKSMETAHQHINCSDSMGYFGDGLNVFNNAQSNFIHGTISNINDNQRIKKGIASSISDPALSFMNIQMIMSQYFPKLYIIRTPSHAQADIMNQAEHSPHTIFSSLVSAVIPTYMNQVGLASIGFRYNSANEATQILHVEPNYDQTESELQHKIKSFFVIMQSDLFPVLLGNVGHFDLQVMSCVNSTTNVVLNLLDFTMLPIGSVYQENSFLGGIVSPLVGNGINLYHNNNQLHNLITAVGDYVS